MRVLPGPGLWSIHDAVCHNEQVFCSPTDARACGALWVSCILCSGVVHGNTGPRPKTRARNLKVRPPQHVIARLARKTQKCERYTLPLAFTLPTDSALHCGSLVAAPPPPALPAPLAPQAGPVPAAALGLPHMIKALSPHILLTSHMASTLGALKDWKAQL